MLPSRSPLSSAAMARMAQGRFERCRMGAAGVRSRMERFAAEADGGAFVMTLTLEKTITGALTPLGFHRQRRRWHRIKDDFIELVDLQASRWGPQFYLNAGILIR